MVGGHFLKRGTDFFRKELAPETPAGENGEAYTEKIEAKYDVLPIAREKSCSEKCVNGEPSRRSS